MCGFLSRWENGGTEKMLKIEHLTKKYGEKKAVDDLSLQIKPGEIYGFIGHNGAGKTTTLKSCCGILQFESGDIFIDGISVKENPIDCKRKLAYIPDNPDLYEFMTGIQYLNFVADIFGVGAADLCGAEVLRGSLRRVAHAGEDGHDAADDGLQFPRSQIFHLPPRGKTGIDKNLNSIHSRTTFRVVGSGLSGRFLQNARL